MTTRGWVCLALVALAAGAFAARSIPALPLVFPGAGEVRLLGADSYYHLRQARRVAERLPVIERRDVATRYPLGDRAASAGLFAVGLAGVARALGGSEGARPWVEPVAAWSAPVLGALAIFALFALARLWLGAWGALACCALFGLAPGPALPVTVLGFADHHAAEIVLALASAAGLTRCARRVCEATDATPWRSALLDALPLAVFAFAWLGAALYVGVAALALIALCWIELALDSTPPRGALAAQHFGLALLAWVLPAALGLPWLVMSQQLFRVYVVAGVALVVLPRMVEVAGRVLVARGVPRGVAATLVGATLAAGGGSLLATTSLGAWLAPRTPNVAENFDLGPLDLASLYGVAMGLAVLAPFAIGRRLIKRKAPLWTVVPGVFAVSLAVVSLRVDDYAYAVAPFVALLAAVAAWNFARRSRTLLAALALAICLPIWPLRWVWSPWPARSDLHELLIVHDGWHEALGWLRRHAPATNDYGVVAAWDFGHAVAALGERPPVWSHGFDVNEAAWWLAEEEADALAGLCPDCRDGDRVRYVIVDARTIAQGLPARMRALGRDVRAPLAWGHRDDDDDRPVPVLEVGRAYTRSIGPRLLLGPAHDLRHFRRVFASRHQSCVFTRLDSRRVLRGIELRVERVATPLSDATRDARCDARAVRDAEGRLVYDAERVPSVAIFEVVPGAGAFPRIELAARQEPAR